jgi:hypothetical protein
VVVVCMEDRYEAIIVNDNHGKNRRLLLTQLFVDIPEARTLIITSVEPSVCLLVISDI